MDQCPARTAFEDAEEINKRRFFNRFCWPYCPFSRVTLIPPTRLRLVLPMFYIESTPAKCRVLY